jgi:hypothetical protein
MKNLFALLALLAAVPAFGHAAAVTTCSDPIAQIGYVRYDYVYGIPPSPELGLPDWTVVWKLSGQEISKTEHLMNGQSTLTGVLVRGDFVEGTYAQLEYVPGDGTRRDGWRTYAVKLRFYTRSTGLIETFVICKQTEGPPVP